MNCSRAVVDLVCSTGLADSAGSAFDYFGYLGYCYSCCYSGCYYSAGYSASDSIIGSAAYFAAHSFDFVDSVDYFLVEGHRSWLLGQGPMDQ